MSDPIVGRTKHGELTLDQIAELQPGLGRLMPEISDAYWTAYYAAKAGNFALAKYFVRKVGSLMKLCSTARPKYAKHLGAYAAGSLVPLESATDAKDFAAFDAAYRKGIDVANRMHVETGHPEIVWVLPPEPPKHLLLEP